MFVMSALCERRVDVPVRLDRRLARRTAHGEARAMRRPRRPARRSRRRSHGMAPIHACGPQSDPLTLWAARECAHHLVWPSRFKALVLRGRATAVLVPCCRRFPIWISFVTFPASTKRVSRRGGDSVVGSCKAGASSLSTRRARIRIWDHLLGRQTSQVSASSSSKSRHHQEEPPKPGAGSNEEPRECDWRDRFEGPRPMTPCHRIRRS